MPFLNTFKPLDFTIQSQYYNTNLHTLIGKIAELRGLTIAQAVECFRTDIRNLPTATGEALDLWGVLLGRPRHIDLPQDTDLYKLMNFYQSNFVRLQFYRVDEKYYLTLSDEVYRALLLFILRGKIMDLTIPTLNTIARDFFGKIGLNCVVSDPVMFKDSATYRPLAMQEITYILDGFPPLWVTYLAKKYDFLPRPAGVGAKIVLDIAKPVGFFMGAGNPANKEITNFFYAKFER